VAGSGQREELTPDEWLVEARKAAEQAQPKTALEALYQSYSLDGLARRLQGKWDSLAWDDIEDAVAGAVDVFYGELRGGRGKSNPVGFLWRVADRKASDRHRQRARESPVEPNSGDLAPGIDDALLPKGTEETDRNHLDPDEVRRRAYSVARSLIPRLGQDRIQKVMTYLIDSLEAGAWEVTPREIAAAIGMSADTVRTSLSRGFPRLRRLASEEGFLSKEGLAHLDEAARDMEREEIE
jgi:DNA-directed RNA polymerase specialized sigma24 family protein